MLNRKSLARLLVDGRRRRKKRGGKAELARPSLGFRHIAIIGRGRVACNVAAINRSALGFVDNFNWKTRSWAFQKVSIFHWPLKKIGKKLLRSWMRFSNVGQISMIAWTWKQTGFHSPWHLPRNIATESRIREESSRVIERTSPIMDPSIGWKERIKELKICSTKWTNSMRL